jgi:hypothetical protein
LLCAPDHDPGGGEQGAGLLLCCKTATADESAA